MDTSATRQARRSAAKADAEERASKASALSDLSSRGRQLSGLASLANDGAAAVAQRRKLQAMFGGVTPTVQLGRDKGKGGTGGGGGGGGTKITEADLLRYYWLFLLQRFLQELQAAYPQNTPQPDSEHVGTKDQLMHPPTSGVKGSDHHTDTSGGGKKGRHVSSKQLIGDVESKIAELLGFLKIGSVPDQCKDGAAWDKWRDEHDPSGGGGGIAT